MTNEATILIFVIAIIFLILVAVLMMFKRSDEKRDALIRTLKEIEEENNKTFDRMYHSVPVTIDGEVLERSI